jgi:5-methylcytosine-specific restriction endonuclease McrA
MSASVSSSSRAGPSNLDELAAMYLPPEQDLAVVRGRSNKRTSRSSTPTSQSPTPSRKSGRTSTPPAFFSASGHSTRAQGSPKGLAGPSSASVEEQMVDESSIDLTSLAGKIHHLRSYTLPRYEHILEGSIKAYREKFATLSKAELDTKINDILELPAYELEAQDIGPPTPQSAMEKEIRKYSLTVKQIEIALVIYEEEEKERTADETKKYAKIITELASNEDKRKDVLKHLFGPPGPPDPSHPINNAIDEHHAVLLTAKNIKKKEGEKGIADWCRRVLVAQDEVIKHLDPSNHNMYRALTTPLYCYANYLAPAHQHPHYLSLFAGVFKYQEGQLDSLAHVMMNECHHAMKEISLLVFRALYNDGMSISTFYRDGEPATIKTGCSRNIGELVPDGVIGCALCNTPLFVSAADLTNIGTAKSACDHTIPMASAFYCLQRGEFRRNLVYLCSTCNKEKTDKGIIELLHDIFFGTIKVPDGKKKKIMEASDETQATYKTVFNKLKPHFELLDNFIDSLMILKSSYDHNKAHKLATIEQLITPVTGAVSLTQFQHQTRTQAQLTSFESMLNIFTNHLAFLVSSEEMQVRFSQDTDQDLDSTEFTALTARVIEKLIIKINHGKGDDIIKDDIIHYFNKIGEIVFYKDSEEIRFNGHEIANVIMSAADADKNNILTVNEFRHFLYTEADKIIQRKYKQTAHLQGVRLISRDPTAMVSAPMDPTVMVSAPMDPTAMVSAPMDPTAMDPIPMISGGGSFNKSIIRRKNKSKITKKVNHRKNKSKITKKLNHRKIKSQKSYRKHTNRLRKHKSFFTKTLKKKI